VDFSVLIQKKCPAFPVLIPTFNNPTYLRSMTEQLFKYNLNDLIILDNHSSTPEMLELLQSFECVVNTDGPYDYLENKNFYDWLPNYFIITDPDIGFNKELPNNFIEIFKEISEKYCKFKVGFALDLDLKEENILDLPDYHVLNGINVTARHWESYFWMHEIGKNELGDPIYTAWLDTTFCLVNKKYLTDPCKNAVRVAGKFTSQHYGWYKNPSVPKNELETYYKLANEKKQIWTHIKL